MTTPLETWIDAALKIMEDNLVILRECQLKKENDLLTKQVRSLKKHVDSFLDFMERRKKLG